MQARTKVDLLHAYTKDGLNLPGVHWEGGDTCVVFIHGMSGNILENYFAEFLGKTLSEKGIGFIYGHNRGYCHINDIRMRKKLNDGENKTTRQGVTYERFSESVFDIDLWINESKKLGYTKIILMGHSLGCNKAIHYLAKKKGTGIIGVILASPPDIVGLVKLPKYQPDYSELLKEAKNNLKAGLPRKLLSAPIWGWYNLSSQTFFDLFQDNCVADNLPLLRNPSKFQELQRIKVPVLAFLGEHDDIVIRSLKEDLNLIKEKATECPNFTTSIVKGANHNYENRESELARLVLEWIKILK